MPENTPRDFPGGVHPPEPFTRQRASEGLPEGLDKRRRRLYYILEKCKINYIDNITDTYNPSGVFAGGVLCRLVSSLSFP